MRFIVDENTGPEVATWLKKQGHEVFSVYEQARDLDYDSIIKKANTENFILITNDKDFGEKVYKGNKKHKGIVLPRLADERSAVKIETIKLLLENYPDKLAENFTVVTETGVRFARK